jgi:hypothetical protein
MENKLLRISGRIIAVLNLLNIMNSTWFFLKMAQFPPAAWLAFNACAPSVLLYLTGFVLKKDYVMSAALPFLLFFGTGGLFVFGWSGTSIYAQIGHISMTLAAVWIITKLLVKRKLFFPAAGFCAGIIVFVLIFPLQQGYVKSHPEYIKKLGDAKFEEFMKNK